MAGSVASTPSLLVPHGMSQSRLVLRLSATIQRKNATPTFYSARALCAPLYISSADLSLSHVTEYDPHAIGDCALRWDLLYRQWIVRDVWIFLF
jgi:hypothetical protein